jgi:hypothetical protein
MQGCGVPALCPFARELLAGEGYLYVEPMKLLLCDEIVFRELGLVQEQLGQMLCQRLCLLSVEARVILRITHAGITLGTSCHIFGGPRVHIKASAAQ